jgi:hypothetical protein
MRALYARIEVPGKRSPTAANVRALHWYNRGVATHRHRLPQKHEAYLKACWYLSRNWPTVAIAAIVGVTPNTVRAWRRRAQRGRIRRAIFGAAAQAS